MISPTERYAKSLQEWVNPPSWAGNFEQAQDRRFEGTCQWMMNDPRYSQWQAQVAGRNKNLANRILSIQGIFMCRACLLLEEKEYY